MGRGISIPLGCQSYAVYDQDAVNIGKIYIECCKVHKEVSVGDDSSQRTSSCTGLFHYGCLQKLYASLQDLQSEDNLLEQADIEARWLGHATAVLTKTFADMNITRKTKEVSCQPLAATLPRETQYQSINQTSIAPVSPAEARLSGSTAKSSVQQQNRGNSSVTSTGHGE